MVSPMLFIIGPLGAAFLMILIQRRVVSLVLALATALGLGVLAFSWLPLTVQGPQPMVVASIPTPLGIPLSLDALGAGMALIVALSALLVILYSSSYMKDDHAPVTYYAVVMLLLMASFGLVLTRDLFNLFVFFEILCISSYILVAWEQNSSALEASFKYMVLGSIGSTFMLVAIALAYRAAGSLAMADIAKAFSQADRGEVIVAAVLFLFGMGVEAAIFPVNTWLPDAHSSAPSSISALLSGFVIELSLVVLFRLGGTVFAHLNLLPVLQGIAIAGILVGEFSAFAQREVKRTLAYSSIAQVGLMLFALSLGTPEGAQAGLMQLLMHAAAKSTLFLVAGYFILRTGSRFMEDYKGLGRSMPLSGLFFGLAALSLVGVPPFLGFFTKWGILQAAVSVGGLMPWIGIISILLGTTLEAVYLFRIFQILYAKGEKERTVEMEWPAVTAVALFVLVVFLGYFLLPVLNPVAVSAAKALTNLF